jgi:hypothetical protein
VGKLGCFLLGFLISSWVSCGVCYFAGKSLLADLRDVHERSISLARSVHADLITAFTRKKDAIGK